MVKNPPALQQNQVQSLTPEDPLEKEMQPNPIFPPGKSPGQRSLAGYSPWGHKESDTTEGLSLGYYSKNINASSSTPYSIPSPSSWKYSLFNI